LHPEKIDDLFVSELSVGDPFLGALDYLVQSDEQEYSNGKLSQTPSAVE
jgi:hypothetical protein